MALYISPALSALIRERSYATGRVGKARKRIARLRQELERSEEVCRAAEEEVGRLSTEIKRLAPKLDQREIKPTKKMQPRRWRTGALNELLIRFLREAPGELRTTDLMLMTAKELGLDLAPQEKYVRHQETIRRQLAKWATMGYVERLHDYSNPRAQGEGRWRWRHQS